MLDADVGKGRVGESRVVRRLLHCVKCGHKQMPGVALGSNSL